MVCFFFCQKKKLFFILSINHANLQTGLKKAVFAKLFDTPWKFQLQKEKTKTHGNST